MGFQDGVLVCSLSWLAWLQISVLWSGTDSLSRKDPTCVRLGFSLVNSVVYLSSCPPYLLVLIILNNNCLPSNLFAHVTFKMFPYLVFSVAQGLGREGMAVAATLCKMANRTPYRWSPLCLSLQSRAEPWVCQYASSGFAVACSRCLKSGYFYWE